MIIWTLEAQLAVIDKQREAFTEKWVTGNMSLADRKQWWALKDREQQLKSNSTTT